MSKIKVYDRLQAKAIWHTQHLRKGRVIWEDLGKNLIVDEGLEYILGAALDSSVPKISNFYVGIYKTNYTVLDSDTGVTFPAAAVEGTEYSEPARPAYNGVSSGAMVDNSAARAEFTFTSGITVYGGFMISLAPKGIGGGTLINAKAFGSPRNPIATDVIRIMIRITLAGV